MPDNNAATATGARPLEAGPVAHPDTTAKWFLISAISYFFIVGIIALTIAAKFCWPELLGTVPYLSYGRLQPGPGIRRAAAAAGHSRGHRVGHVRRQYFRHHYDPQISADVRFALV